MYKQIKVITSYTEMKLYGFNMCSITTGCTYWESLCGFCLKNYTTISSNKFVLIFSVKFIFFNALQYLKKLYNSIFILYQYFNILDAINQTKWNKIIKDSYSLKYILHIKLEKYLI